MSGRRRDVMSEADVAREVARVLELEAGPVHQPDGDEEGRLPPRGALFRIGFAIPFSTTPLPSPPQPLPAPTPCRD